MKAEISTEHSRFLDSDNAYYSVKITLPDEHESPVSVIEGEARLIVSAGAYYPDDELIEACEAVGIDEYDLQNALESNANQVDVKVVNPS